MGKNGDADSRKVEAKFSNYIQMKKLFITLTIISMAVSLHAQFFLGGNIGFSVSSDRTKVKDELTFKSTHFASIFAPKGGYYVNDKFAAGLSFSLGPSFRVTGVEKDKQQWNSFFNWGVAPFVRYHVLTVKKFFFMLEGTIYAGGQHRIGKDTKDEPYTITIGCFNIAPFIGYKLTKHVQLEAGVNFLSLGYEINIRQDKKNNTVNTDHGFTFGANSANIFNVGALTIGAIFKF
jgi:hypothetical protein